MASNQMSAVAAPKSRDIGEQHVHLSQSIEQLACDLGYLFDQLQPVLAPERPTDPSGKPGLEAPLSPHANQLRDLRMKVQSISTTVNILRDRVQL